MRYLFVSVFVFAFSISIFSQTDKPHPNQWKGLTLDQTTAQQILDKFGKPKFDKIEKINVPAISGFLTQELKKKKWRMINYNKIETAKNPIFVFDADSKLVLIHFEIEDLAPQAFINAYNSSFKPIFSGIDQTLNSSDYSRDANGNVYAKNYPTTYYLFAIFDKSYVLGGISNAPSFGQALKNSAGISNSNLTYPGSVKTIELVSRTLENKDNTDVLK